MLTLEIKLEGNPPEWAREATHYFENRRGEQWIAKKEPEQLLLTGQEVRWGEIVITGDMIKEVKEGTREDIGVILNREETYWLVSIFETYF